MQFNIISVQAHNNMVTRQPFLIVFIILLVSVITLLKQNYFQICLSLLLPFFIPTIKFTTNDSGIVQGLEEDEFDDLEDEDPDTEEVKVISNSSNKVNFWSEVKGFYVLLIKEADKTLSPFTINYMFVLKMI